MSPRLMRTVGRVRATRVAHPLLPLALLVALLATGTLGYVGRRISPADAPQAVGLRLIYDL